MKLTLGNCKMQANMMFLSIKLIWARSSLSKDVSVPWNNAVFSNLPVSGFEVFFIQPMKKGTRNCGSPLCHSVIVANESLTMNWLPLVGQQVVDQGAQVVHVNSRAVSAVASSSVSEVDQI